LHPRIVATGGDTQQPTHAGNRIVRLVIAHELEPFRGIVFVSRANQAAAFDRISRSSLSWRFSRRSRLSSSRSAVVRPPSPRPALRSHWANQFLIDCAVGSNSRASSSGERPARTSSTIWRRNSGGEAALVLPIVDSSNPNSPVSTKPGTTEGPPRPPLPPGGRLSKNLPAPPRSRASLSLAAARSVFPFRA